MVARLRRVTVVIKNNTQIFSIKNENIFFIEKFVLEIVFVKKFLF